MSETLLALEARLCEATGPDRGIDNEFALMFFPDLAAPEPEGATYLPEFTGSLDAITALIGSMDDAIDEMQAAASAIQLYEVQDFDQEMKDMAAIIVDCARLVAEAMPLLRDVGSNGGRLHELTERLVRMEGHADEIHSAGLKKAFQAHRNGDAIQFVVQREIFKHLERIVDAFEDVANVIDGIVIDHS